MTPTQLTLIVYAMSNHAVPTDEREAVLGAIRSDSVSTLEADILLDNLLQHPSRQ